MDTSQKIEFKFGGQLKIVLAAFSPGGGFGQGASISLRRVLGHESIVLQADEAKLTLRDPINEKNTVVLDGRHADFFLGGGGQPGNISVRDASDEDVLALRGDTGEIVIGRSDKPGKVRILNKEGLETVLLDGENGKMVIEGVDILKVIQTLQSQIKVIKDLQVAMKILQAEIDGLRGEIIAVQGGGG